MTRKEQIRMTLPRLDFGLTPSPLMELSRVSAILGKGRRLFIKRDDLLGVGLGGNKVRRFAYYLGEAVTKGADVVIAAGGARSNQTIAAAACAAKAGLKAHLVMPESTNATTSGWWKCLARRFISR